MERRPGDHAQVDDTPQHDDRQREDELSLVKVGRSKSKVRPHDLHAHACVLVVKCWRNRSSLVRLVAPRNCTRSAALRRCHWDHERRDQRQC
jgi:hypothetical protein